MVFFGRRKDRAEPGSETTPTGPAEIDRAMTTAEGLVEDGIARDRQGATAEAVRLFSRAEAQLAGVRIGSWIWCGRHGVRSSRWRPAARWTSCGGSSTCSIGT